MTDALAAAVILMRRYLAGLLDPSISLLEVHKLMYFLQAAGERLRLRYVKAPYGPYAENLRHALRDVEGHLISGYADGGDTPDRPLALVPGTVEEAERCLSENHATQERLDRTAALIEGFETPYGLELLATVHWVATQEGARTGAAITRAVHDWNLRKRPFYPGQIDLAAKRLAEQGWITA